MTETGWDYWSAVLGARSAADVRREAAAEGLAVRDWLVVAVAEAKKQSTGDDGFDAREALAELTEQVETLEADPREVPDTWQDIAADAKVRTMLQGLLREQGHEGTDAEIEEVCQDGYADDIWGASRGDVAATLALREWMDLPPLV